MTFPYRQVTFCTQTPWGPMREERGTPLGRFSNLREEWKLCLQPHLHPIMHPVAWGEAPTLPKTVPWEDRADPALEVSH